MDQSWKNKQLTSCSRSKLTKIFACTYYICSFLQGYTVFTQIYNMMVPGTDWQFSLSVMRVILWCLYIECCRVQRLPDAYLVWVNFHVWKKNNQPTGTKTNCPIQSTTNNVDLFSYIIMIVYIYFAMNYTLLLRFYEKIRVIVTSRDNKLSNGYKLVDIFESIFQF